MKKKSKAIGVKLMEGRSRKPLPEAGYKNDPYEENKMNAKNISEEGQEMDMDDDDEMEENKIINKKTGSLYDNNMDVIKAKQRIEKAKAMPVQDSMPKQKKMTKMYIAKLKKVKI